MSVLAHRDPFLFIDRVTLLDLERGIAVARYDLSRSADVFSGHFPGYPIFPGVLQIEAVAQAGLFLLGTRLGDEWEGSEVRAAHLHGSRFLRPVPPEGEMEIVTQVFDEGLFTMYVGQCLYNGDVCSVSVVDSF